MKNAELMALISDVFYKHKRRHGYGRITLELGNKGASIDHKKAKRLMSKMGLCSPVRRSKHKSYKGTVGKAAPNILQRNFKADRPDSKWATDASEFHVTSGKVHLSPIMDSCNLEIISYSVSTSPSFDQTKEMIDKAFEGRSLNGCILHSDQGWQYQMVPYQNRLKEKGMIQSMSRKGNCLDNSVMENFFGIMKSEFFYGHEFEFKTTEQLIDSIHEYINYYNNDRIKTKLKGMSPVEYRKHSLT